MALFDIGQPPGVPVGSPADAEFNESLSKKMKVVDIIPTYYTVDAANMFENYMGFGAGQVIHLDYALAQNEFHSKLRTVGITDEPTGIRAWMINDSTAEEQFSNQYNNNKLADGYDNAVGNIKQFTHFMNSLGLVSAGTGTANPWAASLLDGKQASLPKVWNQSEYSPTLQIVVKLNSPYGDVESIKQYIIKELIVLLCMVSPLSYDGVTYGNPPFFTVRAYGVSMMNIAVLKSLSINRCGGDIRFNATKQPIDIVVNMSFEPAMPGFAAVMSGDISSFALADVPITDLGLARTEYPGVTTIGSIIESLRPSAPDVIDNSGIFGGIDLFGGLVGGIIDIGGIIIDFTEGLVDSWFD